MLKAIDEFIKKADRVPSIPTQVSSLLQTMDSPSSSVLEIEAMIAGDTTLSARILRLANSAFYYRMAPVTRIRDALTRLGFKTTRSMVVTVWTQSLKAFKHNLREAATVSMLLNHGTVCAVIAKAICEQVSRERAEEVFLAALLHDLGRIVLAFQLGDSYVADVLLVADRKNRATCDVEEEMLGFNHAKLGGRLMQAWRLPALFEEAARGHHDEVRPGETAPELAAVMLADLWATELGHNLARNALRPSPDGLVELLALPDPEQLKETCKDRIATMMDIFEV